MEIIVFLVLGVLTVAAWLWFSFSMSGRVNTSYRISLTAVIVMSLLLMGSVFVNKVMFSENDASETPSEAVMTVIPGQDENVQPVAPETVSPVIDGQDMNNVPQPDNGIDNNFDAGGDNAVPAPTQEVHTYPQGQVVVPSSNNDVME